MDKDQAKRLGKLIRERRQAVGLSTHDLGERVGTPNSTIMCIEQGAFAAPSPDKLARIAEALGMSLADMFGHAGYAVPQELPNFHAYLAARYRHFPQTVVAELTELFDALVARHGLAPQAEPAGRPGSSAPEASA